MEKNYFIKQTFPVFQKAQQEFQMWTLGAALE